MDHPKPWLKYVKVDHISDRTLDLSDMKVQSSEREKVGTVDGLIIDDTSTRPYYLVVDAGGWFKSKHFLVPVGLLTLASDRDSLIVPLTKAQIDRFPGFDLDTFDELTVDGIKQINDATLQVCEPGITLAPAASYSESWTHPAYVMPDWWPAFVPSDGSRVAFGSVEGREAMASTEGSGRVDSNDVSPHFDSRAQPGDVLGLETGGERTYVGDTKEDEDERRQTAENRAEHR